MKVETSSALGNLSVGMSATIASNTIAAAKVITLACMFGPDESGCRQVVVRGTKRVGRIGLGLAGQARSAR